MTEERIREILSKNLATQDVSHATAETCRQAGEEVLARACEGRVLDKADWEMLLKTNDGLARLNLYGKSINTYQDDAVLQYGSADFADLSFLYDAWEAAAVYLAEKIEQLILEGVAAGYEKDIREMAAKARKCKKEACEHITATENMIVGIMEFKIMYSSFKACWRIILGKETYEKTIADRKQHIAIIKNLHLQISAEVNSTAKPS